jgi:protein-S-isoprenylcysteine O-methyltransferase Ste14
MNDASLNNSPPANFPWPVLFIAITVIGGLALDRISVGFMSNFFDNTLLRAAGSVLIVMGAALEYWSVRTLQHQNTTIWPHRSASSLVVVGPYRYTRNPIYIAHFMFLLGLGLLLASPFITFMMPLFSYCEQKFSIEPEERHLLEKFGADFSNYMLQTRRWL